MEETVGPRVLTLCGLRSGEQVTIDLNLLEGITSWYLQQAPEKCRSLQAVTALVHMHDDLKNIMECEDQKGFEMAEDILSDREAG